MYDPNYSDELREATKVLKRPKRSHSYSGFALRITDKENIEFDFNISNGLPKCPKVLNNEETNGGSRATGNFSHLQTSSKDTHSSPPLDPNFISTKSQSLPSISPFNQIL
jgi:hypothetical protein